MEYLRIYFMVRHLDFTASFASGHQLARDCIAILCASCSSTRPPAPVAVVRSPYIYARSRGGRAVCSGLADASAVPKMETAATAKIKRIYASHLTDWPNYCTYQLYHKSWAACHACELNRPVLAFVSFSNIHSCGRLALLALHIHRSFCWRWMPSAWLRSTSLRPSDQCLVLDPPPPFFREEFLGWHHLRRRRTAEEQRRSDRSPPRAPPGRKGKLMEGSFFPTGPPTTPHIYTRLFKVAPCADLAS